MKIAVVGSGAVGTFYGGKLLKAGHEVEFYSPTQVNSLNNKKITVNSIWGDFSFKAKFFENTSKMQKAKLILLTCKNLPNIDYKDILTPLVQKGSTILVFQNGIHREEHLAKLFTEVNIGGAIVFACINRDTPYLIQHTDHGRIKLVPLLKKHYKYFIIIQDLFKEAHISVTLSKNIKQERWIKLLWNIPFNSSSVLFKSNTKELCNNPDALYLINNLLKETSKVANKDGTLLTFVHRYLILYKTRRMTPYYTSMYLDALNNRELEYDAILGEPIRTAQEYGVKVPCMEDVYQRLKKLSSSNK